MRKDGKDGKPHPASPKSDDKHMRVVLVEDIDEIEVDVTPRKNSIRELLGGPFTFLGQYESEGTVLLARRELPDDLADLSVHELREMCTDHFIDTTSMLEKSELVDALLATQLPYNPHKLQPPLDKVRARGDIVLLRVAETEEELDNDDDDDGGQEKEEEEEGKKPIRVLPNEEFFLSYTKEEYIDFASRTDIHAPGPPEHVEDEDEVDDDEDDEEEEGEGEDEDTDGDEDDDDAYDPTMEDEEERQGMLNIVMSEVLRKFREEHGRGPDTRELLEIRGHVARELGVEVATIEAIEESAASAAKKRKAAAPSEAEDDGKPSKHVKFQASLNPAGDNGEGDDDNSPRAEGEDAKPPFNEGNGGKEPNDEDPSDKPED
jgi:hypothetical protein